jgi:hypothetical protein
MERICEKGEMEGWKVKHFWGGGEAGVRKQIREIGTTKKGEM